MTTTPNDKPILTHHRQMLARMESAIENAGVQINLARAMIETSCASRGLIAETNYRIAHLRAKMDACAVCRDALILAIERLIDPEKPR